jgi:hypothetical protein
MLARAAGVARHRALRMVAALVVAAYPVWANPARVNADPAGWIPKFTLRFDDQAAFDAKCRTSGGARLANGNLLIGAGGGIGCPASAQSYGKYDFDANAPEGTTASFELRSADRPVSALQLLTVNGRPAVRLVNGEDGRAQDWPFAYGGKLHRYSIEWTSSGITVLVEGCPRLSDARVSGAQRTFGISATGDGNVPVQVNTLSVSSYGPGGSADNVPADCAQAAAPSAAPPTEDHHGRTSWWWWLGGSALVVVAVTLVVIALRRRAPRKLRPGHRK